MSLSATHIVYSPKDDKILLYETCSNPEKSKAYDRTEEFILSMMRYLGAAPRVVTMANGMKFRVNIARVEEEPVPQPVAEPQPVPEIPAEAEVATEPEPIVLEDDACDCGCHCGGDCEECNCGEESDAD